MDWQPVISTWHAMFAWNWTSVIGPAVVAAVISALVAWFTTSRRFAVDRELVGQKIAADIDLAERKFQFDKELAEHRVQLDEALAEKKLAFDKAMVLWRRRYELAEQVMAAVYEARDALNYARGRLIREGEGKARVATEPENDKVKEARDSAFVPVERLSAHSKAFATLQTLHDPLLAHFGSEAVQPLSEIFTVYHGITNAVSNLIRYAEWNEERQARVSLQPFRDVLYGERAEQASARVEAAVQLLGAVCKPILSGKAPA